jgi:peptide/nickel transport system substrate-binding protein
MRLTRRAALASAVLATPALAQADQRPVLTVAVQKLSNSNTLETPREQSNVGFRLSPSYAEPLIGSDWQGDLGPVPGLATEWRRVDDRTVEFTLRDGVRFHDGRLMTAEDVVFSFTERLQGGPGHAVPPEVPAVAARTFPGFERMEVVRTGVVRFVNRVPDVTLEGRLAQNIGVVLSQDAWGRSANWMEWARRPVGTGPYRVAEYRPDHSLVLEAHDDYWGGRPPARRIRCLEVSEVSSRVNGLFAGEFDLACDMPPDQVPVVERNPRFEVLGAPINNIRLLAFDQTHPQLANPLVRRALSHAVDRQVIVDTLWAGRTRIPKGLQLEYFGETFVQGWDVPAYDPAEARRLLRQAGYKGEAIPYRLLNNYYTNQVANAQIMVEMWRAVGVNVVVEMRENFSQTVERGPTRALHDWSSTSLFADPVSGLVRSLGPQGDMALAGEWRNAEFHALASVLETSTDRAARRAAHRRMLEIAEREDPACMVLHQAANFTAKRRDIRWRAAKAWTMDFRASNLRFAG